MFKTYENKSLTQWEQGQMVINDDMRVGDKVTFHDASGHTVIMTAYDYNGTVVADIPNTMMATPHAIVVTLGNGANARPEERTKIKMVPADKPDDYKFIDNRPTSVSLEKRVEAVEAVGSPDWNASEGEAGHIKNRTHYEQINLLSSVTETITGENTSSYKYGTMPYVVCKKDGVWSDNDKRFIIIRLGDVECEVRELPPSSGGSRPTFEEYITLSNGVTVHTKLSDKNPVSGASDRKGYYYQVIPVVDDALTPYIGQTFSVTIYEDRTYELDPKFITNGVFYANVWEATGGGITSTTTYTDIRNALRKDRFIIVKTKENITDNESCPLYFMFDCSTSDANTGKKFYSFSAIHIGADMATRVYRLRWSEDNQIELFTRSVVLETE